MRARIRPAATSESLSAAAPISGDAARRIVSPVGVLIVIVSAPGAVVSNWSVLAYATTSLVGTEAIGFPANGGAGVGRGFCGPHATATSIGTTNGKTRRNMITPSRGGFGNLARWLRLRESASSCNDRLQFGIGVAPEGNDRLSPVTRGTGIARMMRQIGSKRHHPHECRPLVRRLGEAKSESRDGIQTIEIDLRYGACRVPDRQREPGIDEDPRGISVSRHSQSHLVFDLAEISPFDGGIPVGEGPLTRHLGVCPIGRL